MARDGWRARACDGIHDERGEDEEQPVGRVLTALFRLAAKVEHDDTDGDERDLRILGEGVALAAEEDAAGHDGQHLARLAQHLRNAWVGHAYVSIAR